jgi:hypothetical protein
VKPSSGLDDKMGLRLEDLSANREIYTDLTRNKHGDKVIEALDAWSVRRFRSPDEYSIGYLLKYPEPDSTMGASEAQTKSEWSRDLIRHDTRASPHSLALVSQQQPPMMSPFLVPNVPAESWETETLIGAAASRATQHQASPVPVFKGRTDPGPC